MTLWYRFCRDLVFRLSRLVWGLQVVGRENLPREGPVIIACNHISLLDPPVLGSSIPRESGFVAKIDLFANPGMARLLGSLNAIPIDRSTLSRETMELLADFLRSGRALVFFPEGTRSRSGELRRGKVGIGVLLEMFPVPVVPTVIEGTNAPFRNLFRRGRVRLVFGRPFALPKGASDPSDRREIARRHAETVMERIRELQEGTTRPDGDRPPAATAPESPEYERREGTEQE